MAISFYLKSLRDKVGNQLLLVPSVAAIVRDERGFILLQRTTENNEWSLPGGAIDPGETHSQAVIREVREETGLLVHPTTVLAVLGGGDFRYVYANGDHVEYAITVFACERIGGVFGESDDETAELDWFPHAMMPPLTLPYPPALFAPPAPSGPLFL